MVPPRAVSGRLFRPTTPPPGSDAPRPDPEGSSAVQFLAGNGNAPEGAEPARPDPSEMADHLTDAADLPPVAGAVPVERAGFLFGQVHRLTWVHQVRLPVLIAPSGDGQADQGDILITDAGRRGAFVPGQELVQGGVLVGGERGFNGGRGGCHSIHTPDKRAMAKGWSSPMADALCESDLQVLRASSR